MNTVSLIALSIKKYNNELLLLRKFFLFKIQITIVTFYDQTKISKVFQIKLRQSNLFKCEITQYFTQKGRLKSAEV
jgi:hypothetical protein